MRPTSNKDQRETARMRDICARDIADRVVAGDTISETFAAAVRVYQQLTDELAENARQVAE
ncbi:hypothetical protein [Brevibacterium sediminis]